MPEDQKPVVPAAPVTQTPPELSGRQLLKTAKIDYTETEEPAPAPTATPNAPASSQAPAATAPVVPAPVVKDPKDVELERLRIQERLNAMEAERVKAQNELLLSQAKQSQEAPAQEVNIDELFQQDPLSAMRYIAEQTAIRVRQETLAQVQQQEQAQAATERFVEAQKAFSANIEKIKTENKELQDPNHRLTQIYIGLEQEFPHFMTIAEGPLKAMEIAKQRYELEKLKATPPVTPTQVSEAVKQGQEIEARRQEQVQAASMVAGSSRGVPPSPAVKLTPEEELAARRLRMTPETYTQFKPKSPKYFKKEEAPRRKVSA